MIFVINCLAFLSHGQLLLYLFQGLPGTAGPTGDSGLPGAKGMTGPPGYQGGAGRDGEDVS